MSGFPTQPPTSSSKVFNPSFYAQLSGDTTPASIKAIIPGTADASKALVLDSSKNISTIGNLTANRLLSLNSNTAEAYRSTCGTSVFTMNHDLNSNFNINTNNPIQFRCNGVNKFSVSSGACISDVRLSAPSLHCGTIVDAARMISALDDTMATGNVRYITLGRSNAINEQAEISFVYNSSTSTSSTLGLGFYGVANVLSLQANRTMMFNATSAAAGAQNGAFHINGSLSKSVGPGYGLYSGGVYSFSGSTQPISLYTSSSIWCNDTVYSTSDKRLKCNIDPIGVENSKKLLNAETVTYNWVSDPNCVRKQVGLIAQNLLEIGLPDLVGIVPNDTEGLDGFSYVVQYDKVAVYLIDIVKSLSAEINEIKDITDKLAARPAVAKWLSKQTS
jgi:hypothetical protein